MRQELVINFNGNTHYIDIEWINSIEIYSEGDKLYFKNNTPYKFYEINLLEPFKTYL